MSSFFHRGWCHSSAHTHTCPHSPDVCNPWENRGTATGTGWPHTQPLLQEAHCTHTSLKGFSVNHHLILANGEKLQTRVEIGPAEPIQVKKQELCFFWVRKGAPQHLQQKGRNLTLRGTRMNSKCFLFKSISFQHKHDHKSQLQPAEWAHGSVQALAPPSLCAPAHTPSLTSVTILQVQSSFHFQTLKWTTTASSEVCAGV